MKKAEARGIQSIDVSGRILKAILQSATPVMLKDIAAEADIAAAQVHAYLSSFKRMDLVVQNVADGRYSLGALALRLGLAYRDSYLPMRAASETLEAINARTGFAAALVIWTARGPTVFEVRAGRETLNVNIRPGTILRLTGSTVGAIFAANLSAETLAPVGDAERSFSGTAPGQWEMSKEQMSALVATAETEGFAALSGQPIAGVSSIAIALHGPAREFIGALLILGHETQLDVARAGALCQEVRDIMTDRIAGAAL